jgi:hypothetical protein
VRSEIRNNGTRKRSDPNATKEGAIDDEKQLREARKTADAGARRTGRTVQFATVTTEECKRWMKETATKVGKSQAALLDDMRAAYIEKYGE